MLAFINMKENLDNLTEAERREKYTNKKINNKNVHKTKNTLVL